MTEVWVVTRLTPDGFMEINGVYSTQEKALEACTDDLTAAARFEVDYDYSEVTDFLVVTRKQPFLTLIGRE